MCCQCHHTYPVLQQTLPSNSPSTQGCSWFAPCWATRAWTWAKDTSCRHSEFFFYEPFRGQGELLIIETFRPEVLTLGILTVGQTYIQEECEIYKASIVLGKLGKGYIIRGILVGGDIRLGIRWNRKYYYKKFFYLYICAYVEVYLCFQYFLLFIILFLFINHNCQVLIDQSWYYSKNQQPFTL